VIDVFTFLLYFLGHAVAQLVLALSPVLYPDEVKTFFTLPNPSSRTLAQGLLSVYNGNE
jgi:hypothetical protein